MFIVYFALWVIFNGKWTTEIGVFGLIFAAVLYAFSCKFMGYSVKTDIGLLLSLWRGVRYGALLIAEILKANFAVIDLILHKSGEVEPQLVRFSTDLKSENHRVVLADSITLTPGTITCELEDGRYLVHCLDKSLADGIERSSFVDALASMEYADADKQAAKAQKAADKEAARAGREAAKAAAKAEKENAKAEREAAKAAAKAEKEAAKAGRKNRRAADEPEQPAEDAPQEDATQEQTGEDALMEDIPQDDGDYEAAEYAVGVPDAQGVSPDDENEENEAVPEENETAGQDIAPGGEQKEDERHD